MPENLDFYTSRYLTQASPNRDGIRCTHHPLLGEIRLHLHDFYEMELVTEGTIPQKINGAPLAGTSGDFVLMDLRSTQRILRPEPSAPGRPPMLLTLGISTAEADPAVLHLLSSLRLPLSGHLSLEKTKKVLRVAEELSEAIVGSSPYTREKISALTVFLLSLLCEEGKPLEAGTEEARGYHYIRAALVYLNENYQNPISLSELAAAIHISPCYLSDLFSRLVGCRFTEYLTTFRLKKARKLLRDGNASVARISAVCGFTTPANFTRTHRRVYGISPTDYRKNIGQDKAPDEKTERSGAKSFS